MCDSVEGYGRNVRYCLMVNNHAAVVIWLNDIIVLDANPRSGDSDATCVYRTC